ncbi:3-dehydroquinate dehydratase, partial [Paenibacillus sp. MCAF20]
LKTCIKSLISVEIVGSEATLHSLSERDTLTISLY